MNKLTTKKFVANHSPENSKIAEYTTFLSDSIVDNSVTIIVNQWDQSSHYVFYQITSNKFLVQRRFNTANDEVTKYITTHLVTVRNYSDTQRVIVCSCGHYHRHNIPWRHIYAVTLL